ncbi:glycosyltransferase [Microbacterium sp. ARD31]|uniref:glycosyltransferase n=1 Tax=Microbacterium sp. ARD31 TaxID=2962576 RepID=UPI002882743C|nr:glycosyltransferase [Microbacterium sp. ARD31]MDT0186477.1 glycosyltransferase [Microbacterium sp. ARD31]
MRIVQIVPTIGPGSGVAGVAWNLDREFRKLGVETETITYSMTSPPRSITPRGPISARLATMQRVVLFSIQGTRFIERFLAERPDAVSICHNDAVVGDIYVNHGVLHAAMRARGMVAFRYLRNPMHIFTHVRDRRRYRGDTHRVVVALADTEAAALRKAFGRVHPPVVVIPNGVDLDRFRPPTPAERLAARTRLGLRDSDRVFAFVGHEFDRKGLPLLVRALQHAPRALLLVVGGDRRQIETARRQAQRAGVAERVLFVGRQPDVLPFLHAADVFALPSAYEANALALLEALACGLPVIATPVGGAAATIADGKTGFLVPADAHVIGDRMEGLMDEDLAPWSESARESATAFSWTLIAQRYLDLADRVARERG